MNHHRLQTQREVLAGKNVIGIDPAKDKHQAAVVDVHGNQRGASFSFPVTATGYGEILWRNIAKVIPSCNVQEVVFAIETACNLWETLAFYLRTRGYSVVLVSPLSNGRKRRETSRFLLSSPAKRYRTTTVLTNRQAFEHGKSRWQSQDGFLANGKRIMEKNKYHLTLSKQVCGLA
jgi:hypothetical protein